MAKIYIGDFDIWVRLEDAKNWTWLDHAQHQIAELSHSEFLAMTQSSAPNLPIIMPSDPFAHDCCVAATTSLTASKQDVNKATTPKLFNSVDKTLCLSHIFDAAQKISGHRYFRTTETSVRANNRGDVFIYCHPDLIAGQLQGLVERIEHEPPGYPPLAFAVGVMMEFLQIHPFVDGNGRIARQLCSWVLASRLNNHISPDIISNAMAWNKLAFLAAYLCWEFDQNPEPLCRLICMIFANRAAPS